MEQRPFTINLNLSEQNVIQMPNAYKKELSDEEMDEVMNLYNQISEIFIKNKTSLYTSFVVLSSMADALELHLYNERQNNILKER